MTNKMDKERIEPLFDSSVTVTYEDEQPDGSWRVVGSFTTAVPDQSMLRGAPWIDMLVAMGEPDA